MKHFAILAAVIVAFATSATAQRKGTSHASREAAIQLLQRESIISSKTLVVSTERGADARWWLVIPRHPSGTVSTWTVDSSAQNYQYVCKH
jgi:hypothetical protein